MKIVQLTHLGCGHHITQVGTRQLSWWLSDLPTDAQRCVQQAMGSAATKAAMINHKLLAAMVDAHNRWVRSQG